MAKKQDSKKIKGEDIPDEVIVEGFTEESMNMPPVPDDDAFDREQAEVARKVAAREAEIEASVPAGAGGPEDPLLSRLTMAMEVIASQSNRSEATDRAFDRMAAAFERMAENQILGANKIAQATKLTTRPENASYPGISVYNMRGDKDFPRPTLRCRMLLPWPCEEESQTREELELLNLLVPGEYMVKRNDATKVKLTVRATYKLDSDSMDTVIINHDTAFNNDYHRLMPPMPDWLRQMLKQNPKTRVAADRVLSMDEEAALIMAGQLNDSTVPEDGKVVSVGE